MNEIEAVGAEEMVLGPEPGASASIERPWLFALLNAPIAVLANGLAGGVLSYLFRQQHVPVERSAAILGLLILPQTIYFLWSPITDLFIRRRTWLMLGALAAGATIAAAFQRSSLSAPATVALMFLGVCFGQLVVSSCGGMMGTLHSERNRLLASSSYQAGGLGFGAGAILVLTMLSSRMTLRMLGLVAAGMIVAPALAALAAPEQERVEKEGLRRTLRGIGREFKANFWSRRALPYIAIALFPMGSGAAIGLLPGVAQDYGVSASHMAWMNGFAGALLTAGGAMSATLIPVRIRASVSYCCCTLVNILALCLLCLGPMRASTYFVGVALYLFTIGTCYAMFTAVTLEFMGRSGRSGSGRYAIFNSMGNVPVSYMTAIDGVGAKWFGTRGLTGTEAVVGTVGAVILLGYFLTRGPVKADADSARLAA